MLTASQLFSLAQSIATAGFVEVTQPDREQMAVGLFFQGYAAGRACQIAFVELEDNDGALQMLARHRRRHPTGANIMTNDKDGAVLLRADVTYLATCALSHADKFPVPEHMRSLSNRILAALQSHGQAFDADMRAFGASDAACYLYPGEDQAAERAAYCAGASSAQACDAVGIEYGDAAQDAVMRLLETGWATVNSAGYLARALPIPEAPASVVDREITTKPVAVGETAAGVTQAPASVEPVGGVSYAVYESAVKGRQDFRAAYKAQRDLLSAKEWQVVEQIGRDAELSISAVLRQSVRLYQLHCDRLKAGETFSWSGDEQRLKDFAGPLYTRPEPDTIGSHFGNGGGLDPVEAKYLICKGGAYYRPNAQGYTRNKAEAGRYTLEEATSYSHPNGPDGPRDGITYELDTAPPSPGFGGGDLREAALRCILNTASQDRGSKGDLRTAMRMIAGMADKALAALPPVKQSVGEGLINQSRKVRNYSDPNDVFEAVPTRFIVEAGERALSHDQRGGSGE